MSPLNKMLDSDAEQLLDILANDYKDLLIEFLSEDTNRARGISKRMIMEKDQEIKSIIIKMKKNQRAERQFKVLVLAGAIYVLIGIMFYIYSNSYILRLSSSNSLSIAMILSGLSVVLIGYIYKAINFNTLFYNRSKKIDIESVRVVDKTEEYIFIEKWTEFEQVARNVIGDSSNSIVGIGMIVKDLSLQGKISLSDQEVILKALTLRNMAIHGGHNDLKYEDTKDLLSKLDSIIQKISN